ncbi:MAG: hypothetical protein A3K10_09440 [Bacteroidetes bacterium RIFCSPLOWO2_12_FULL_31_6]|nr:MAG: hypothetical protein A3K10_09440 [Bacteroidetes bacterium RIFCSPLOWO2_12_FULL_31_6]
MKDILKTTQLEFDKSFFLIDLIELNTGKIYIEIAQTIHTENKGVQIIKINPTILSNILDVLQEYQSDISDRNNARKLLLTEKEQNKIQDRYLKGLSINELALQFEETEENIEMILRNKGIEIISNEIPEYLKKDEDDFKIAGQARNDAIKQKSPTILRGFFFLKKIFLTLLQIYFDTLFLRYWWR